jgi:hypothetical protein
MSRLSFLKPCGIWENMVYVTKSSIAFTVESFSLKVLWSRLLGFQFLAEGEFLACSPPHVGARSSVVKALCYKPEGHEFDSQCHWIL